MIKKEQNGGVTIYHYRKKIEDDKMDSIVNTKLKPSQIDFIIDHDADVYAEDGALLLKFRKGKLPVSHVDAFYENVIKFAKNKTNNRGNATGSKKFNVWENPKIMTNIFGFFDKWSPRQKYVFTKNNASKPLEVRECRFNMDYPEEYKKAIPLIKDIDRFYKKYVPSYYAKQHKKAVQTHFRIPQTSFTTVTTNVNYQTTVHKDKGDDQDGFGNLTVIEKGQYKGGETCFPQYGIGVDVRTNDILFMDVHQWHANLPIELESDDAVRLSVVCYLRINVWEKTKNKTKRFFIKHNKTLKKMRNIDGDKNKE
jgi:Oxygenase domain of the 2OGFeDO superfamily